ARNPKAGALVCADKTAEFIAQFEVPRSLKAAGVPRNEIAEIVPTVQHELQRSGVVDRPLTNAEVMALLEASY
ncbi:MAG TPA: hypothetical protein VLY22_00820, partial [Candidatus Nitrosotalea sp.]|nr:hypothetical protein [Candidatus Nitrosotalea sp.]